MTTIHDENWDLASSVQLTPAAVELGPGELGVVIARTHPTGWFVSARYRPGLAVGDLEDFAEFVRVRVYLLLENGPTGSVWEPTRDQEAWRAVCTPSRLEMPEEVEAFR